MVCEDLMCGVKVATSNTMSYNITVTQRMRLEIRQDPESSLTLLYRGEISQLISYAEKKYTFIV